MLGGRGHYRGTDPSEPRCCGQEGFAERVREGSLAATETTLVALLEACGERLRGRLAGCGRK